MKTLFETLLTLKLSHEYYGGPFEDFEFVLPADTERTMRNGKILPRVQAGAIRLLFQADSPGVPRISIGGKTIRIGLKLLNPYFGNFTELNVSPGRSLAVYRNSAAPGALAPLENIGTAAVRFQHVLQTTDRPVTITVTDPNGVSGPPQSVGVLEDKSVGLDLSSGAAGAWRVEESSAVGVVRTNYYSDPNFQAEGIFGVVEILVAESFYANPPEFEISFVAKRETLKYYVVVTIKPNPDLTLFMVSDKGFEKDQRPEVKFSTVAVADFASDDIQPNFLLNKNSKLVLFKSTAVVPRSKNARKNIQLNRNGTTLIQHLPQPGVDRVTADMIVHVSKREV